MIKNIQNKTGLNMTFLNTIKVKLIGILSEIVDPIVYAVGDSSYKVCVVTKSCQAELDIFTDDKDFVDDSRQNNSDAVTFEWHYSSTEHSYTRSTGKMYLCDSSAFNEESLHNLEPSELYSTLTTPLLKLIHG